MTSRVVLTAIGFTMCSFFSLNAQLSLPYFSGFDDVAQQVGWTEYKTGQQLLVMGIRNT